MGLDAAMCATPCGPSNPIRILAAPRRDPYAEHGMRLAMLLPTDSVEQAKALIGRGQRLQYASGQRVLPDHQRACPQQPGNILPRAGVVATRKLTIKRLNADAIENEKDVMVYQTGMARVAKLIRCNSCPVRWR
jgi:hypothetical protein